MINQHQHQHQHQQQQQHHLFERNKNTHSYSLYQSNNHDRITDSPTSITTPTTNYENRPFARILYDGVLIALINTNGTILYSQMKGDAIFGSFSSTRGRNILEYIKSGDGYDLLESFFSQPPGKQSQELMSQIFAKNFFETRFGHHVSLEINSNFSLNDFSTPHVIESLPPRIGLLSLANLQSSIMADELSFNDAFG